MHKMQAEITVGDEINVEITTKTCKKCGQVRKFLKDSPRDKESICGNCWDWDNEPKYVKLTPRQAQKLKELLGME